MLKKTRLTIAAGAVVALSAGAALADWPDRPIKLIVPFAAGGGADATARTLLPYMEKHLAGADFVVVNRPGAGGAVGTLAVANSSPDGYSIVQLQTPVIVTKRLESPNAGFDENSFEYIGNVVSEAATIAVLKSSEIKTLKDLLEFAKANPGRFLCGHPGDGASNHLLMLRLMKAANVKFTLVPFEGGSQARLAVLGGHTNGACISSSGLAPSMDELNVLGQAADKRVPELPHTPTFKEQGVNISGGSQRIWAVPKGTPPEIVEKLREALTKAMADPEYLAKVKEMGLPIEYIPGPTIEKLLHQESKEYSELWAAEPWIKK